MSMTREEAIKYGENKLTTLGALGYNDFYTPGEYCGYYDEFSFVTAALSTLRPFTREQAEKVWRGEWVHKRSPYDYKIFVCEKCGKQISIQGENMDFCPACGAAQTDKAVEMVMKRLEALKDGSETD